MTQKPNAEDETIHLEGERLRLDIAKPGTAYGGSRFDWTGLVLQVTLNHAHTFCVPESLTAGQGTGGIGLCNEFGIFTPVGYEDAKPGEWFPKLGVGLLKRPDESEYGFAKPYEIRPFSVSIRKDETGVRFQVDPLETRGYAVSLTKRLSISENRLIFDYRLNNIGQKPVVTQEYAHNFVAVNGHPIGPDYELSFSFTPVFKEIPSPLTVHENRIGWIRPPEGAFYGRPTGFKGESGHWWELRHLPTGAGMRETVDFPLELAALWGTNHTVSPEFFKQIRLQPGESLEWRRTYEFFAE